MTWTLQQHLIAGEAEDVKHVRGKQVMNARYSAAGASKYLRPVGSHVMISKEAVAAHREEVKQYRQQAVDKHVLTEGKSQEEKDVALEVTVDAIFIRHQNIAADLETKLRTYEWTRTVYGAPHDKLVEVSTGEERPEADRRETAIKKLLGMDSTMITRN